MLFSTDSVEFSLTYVASGCSFKQLQTPTQHVPQHVLWHADAKQALILVCCVVLHGADVLWTMTVEPCCIIIEKYRSWLMNPGYVTGVQLRLCIIVLRPSKINSLSNQVMLNLVERVIHLLLPSLLHRAEQQTILLIKKRQKFLYWHQLRIQPKPGTCWWKICSQQPLTFKIAEMLKKGDSTFWQIGLGENAQEFLFKIWH